jgi:hypothetical protein
LVTRGLAEATHVTLAGEASFVDDLKRDAGQNLSRYGNGRSTRP